MAEYIDRDAVLSAIKDYAYDCFVKDLGRRAAAADEIGNLISKLSTSDVRPIVCGKWEEGICSECGEHAPYWPMASTYHASAFCPNCGADMRRMKPDG